MIVVLSCDWCHCPCPQEERIEVQQQLESCREESESKGRKIANLERLLAKAQELVVTLTQDKVEQHRAMDDVEKEVMSLRNDREEIGRRLEVQFPCPPG